MSKKKDGNQRVCFLITSELSKKLRLAAAQREKSMSDLVRLILSDFLAHKV